MAYPLILWLAVTPCRQVLHVLINEVFLGWSAANSLQIRTQTAKLCSSAFPHFTVRFIFQSGRRLSGFFSFKDRIPKLMRSHIHKYSYQCCRALCFRQTRRHFHTRISEGMGVLPLMGKKLATNSISSVLAHSHQSLHHIWLMILLSFLLVENISPSLNENISFVPLSLF